MILVWFSLRLNYMFIVLGENYMCFVTSDLVTGYVILLSHISNETYIIFLTLQNNVKFKNNIEYQKAKFAIFS